MDTCLVREGTIAATTFWGQDDISSHRKKTYVIGFMKGILTSTASATKFSISRSMGRLYLALTYSGSAA